MVSRYGNWRHASVHAGLRFWLLEYPDWMTRGGCTWEERGVVYDGWDGTRGWRRGCQGVGEGTRKRRLVSSYEEGL
jgi:hypothetical protein